MDGMGRGACKCRVVMRERSPTISCMHADDNATCFGSYSLLCLFLSRAKPFHAATTQKLPTSALPGRSWSVSVSGRPGERHITDACTHCRWPSIRQPPPPRPASLRYDPSAVRCGTMHMHASSTLPASRRLYFAPGPSIRPSVRTITEVTPCDPSMHAYICHQ